MFWSTAGGVSMSPWPTVRLSHANRPRGPDPILAGSPTREAYVEWRREALRGRGDDFCDEQAQGWLGRGSKFNIGLTL